MTATVSGPGTASRSAASADAAAVRYPVTECPSSSATSSADRWSKSGIRYEAVRAASETAMSLAPISSVSAATPVSVRSHELSPRATTRGGYRRASSPCTYAWRSAETAMGQSNTDRTSASERKTVIAMESLVQAGWAANRDGSDGWSDEQALIRVVEHPAHHEVVHRVGGAPLVRDLRVADVVQVRVPGVLVETFQGGGVLDGVPVRVEEVAEGIVAGDVAARTPDLFHARPQQAAAAAHVLIE